MSDVIHFFWEGDISPRRLELLQNCVYSTSAYNPTHTIRLVSNTLKQDQFDHRYRILVEGWDRSDFNDIPVDANIIDTYINTGSRTLSDFFRLVLLYKHGGGYSDTDNLCIGPLPALQREIGGILCRSYDPHTAHYQKLKDEDCIPGTFREISGYSSIPFFPRNDCWLNFAPKSPFIHRMFAHPSFVAAKHPLDILGGVSFQSLTNTVAKEDITPCSFGMNLLYLYESFLAGCSGWDTREGIGEMHDIYKECFPDLDKYPWGQYRCNRHVARDFMFECLKKYPSLSFMWLHGKEDMSDLFETPDPDSLQFPSTWLYHYNVEYMRLLV